MIISYKWMEMMPMMRASSEESFAARKACLTLLLAEWKASGMKYKMILLILSELFITPFARE
jgi:hypothetical protein